MSHDDWPTSELAREWTHRGVTCRVYVADYFNNGYKRPNGYVELPEDHPARHLNLQWDDCEVFDVHGGITYGGDGRRVIGWDTAHHGDNWEGDPTKPGRLWTVDDVEGETTRLADQVADLYTSESVAMFKAATRLRELADELDPTKETRMTGPEYPHSYKELHGAPYDDDPGPWPYLTVIAFAALTAVCILIATYI